MRNLAFTSNFLMLIVNIGYCQINLSADGVGINRSAPAKGIAVKGGNGGNINIDNGGEQYNDIDFLNSGVRRALLGLDNTSNVFRIVSEKNDQDFLIQTGGFNERFRIKSNGQIGIGMQSWQDYKVSINADNVFHPFVLYNDKNQMSQIDFWNASSGTNAGISNRFVTNKPNTSIWNVASIDKYRNGLWAFRNYDSNGKIEFDLQDIAGNTTPELVIENDGGVKIPSAAIKFGGIPIAGSMRWTGTDFEGYNGSQWISLNGSTPQPSYNVGQLAHGGVIFWIDPSSDGKHGLVASLEDQTTNSGIQFSNGIIYKGAAAFSVGYYGGQRNSEKVCAAQLQGLYAVQIALTYSGGDYGDWYLPSKNELKLMYDLRTIIGGFNSNSSSPTFSNYWSSSELPTQDSPDFYTNAYAYAINFSNGTISTQLKSNKYRVRAIRRF